MPYLMILRVSVDCLRTPSALKGKKYKIIWIPHANLHFWIYL